LKEYQELISRVAIAIAIIIAAIIISYGLKIGLMELGIWLSGR
jgi:hypothetical protein